jgi:hypothetical protein
MLRGAAILTGALALLGLSAASGMDRMARTNPALAAEVPLPFARAALRTLGGQALSGGRGKDAASYGWHALNRAPFEAESVALFAAGQLAEGNAPMAERAFGLAGRMGWRVPITQAYWLNRAMLSRDYDTAAMRLDALLRQQPTLVGQQALLDPVERDPAARAALVDRIDPDTAWLGKYLGEVFALPPQVLRQRARVMIDAAGAGLVLGCDAMSNLAAAMTNAGLYREAGALWAAQCPASGGLLMGGEGFATLDLLGTRNPFAWQAQGSGDVLLTLAPQPAGRGRRLTIAGTPPTTRPFIAKTLLLTPGRYRLGWRAGADNGAAGDRIRVSLGCKGQAEAWLPAETTGDGLRRTAVVRITADCPAHALIFALAAGGGNLWLEDVRLDPLP